VFHVREVFPTFQGEGSRAGQPAVFVRFTGCNLWSGLERGRMKGRGDCARWCDTDFVHGSPYEVEALVEEVARHAQGMARTLVVLTGGEPLLQVANPDRLDQGLLLVETMRRRGWEVAVETNGTKAIPRELAPILSHVTVSPKAIRGEDGEVLVTTDHLHAFAAQDLKIVVPCPMPVEALVALYRRATVFFQPMDAGDIGAGHLAAAFDLARLHGGRLSLQTHKFAGMP
jgi:7-carboxy-7-deazaguanine synthase